MNKEAAESTGTAVSPDGIRDMLIGAISSVASRVSDYVYNPGKDFTRVRKMPPDALIRFLIAEGSGSTKNELLDYFNMDVTAPSASAFNHQRSKLKPEAMEAVFNAFYLSGRELYCPSAYLYIAADGSDLVFTRDPSPDAAAYHVSEGHSIKGFNSMHINALYDLDRKIYTDALIQPVHKKDEFRAFCDMVDRFNVPNGAKVIFIGDRGYPSYNTMAHVFEKGQYFLFRTKDTASKGMTRGFGLPDLDEFDVQVKVSIVRRNSAKIECFDAHRRFVDSKVAFDYVEYGSSAIYSMTFRVVRLQISSEEHECLVTNLPADEFPAEEINRLYCKRWSIESSFRKLKYTVGLSNLHARKPQYVKQEVWARLIAYNFTETITNHVVISSNDTKYEYQVDFSAAAHICRVFIRQSSDKRGLEIAALIQKHTQPVRPDRHYERLKTAHFRKPKNFTCRAA
jgi:hypothetical protein